VFKNSCSEYKYTSPVSVHSVLFILSPSTDYAVRTDPRTIDPRMIYIIITNPEIINPKTYTNPKEATIGIIIP
jgi:hypothetical protein